MSVFGNTPQQKLSDTDTNKIEFIPGEVIVKYNPKESLTIQPGIIVQKQTINDKNIDELNKKFGVFEYKKLKVKNPKSAKTSGIKNSETLLLRFDKSHDATSVAEEYTKLENVQYAEPNYVYYTSEVIPNDPDYPEQWHLHKISASEAWGHEQGDTNIVIGILDTGVDWDHPDLVGQIWINPGEDLNGNGIIDESDFNGIDDDGNGYIDDLRGWDFVDGVRDEAAEGEDAEEQDNDPMDFHTHGTHCAGIASATINNGIGITGIAPNCKVIPLRAGFADPNGGGLLTAEAISEGIYYAADMEVNIVSMSFGGAPFSVTMLEAYQYAVSKGVILVAAAGNSNSSAAHYPAAYPGVVAVAATSDDDSKAFFSNYGNWVDISAPGENILSTIFDDTYETYSGTSMATPLTAGLTALIESANKGWGDEEIVIQLISTADNIDTINTGYKYSLGTGRINALKALTESSSPKLKIWNVKYDYYYDEEHEGLIDTFLFKIDLYNSGLTANNVYIKIKCDNQYVTLLTDSLFYGNINYEDTIILNQYFGLNIDPSAPLGETANLEILVISTNADGISDKTEILLNNPYKQLTGYPANLENMSISMFKTADLDNDGEKELICLAERFPIIQILNVNGDIERTISFYQNGYDVSPVGFALADIDNDDDLEIILNALLEPVVWEVDKMQSKTFVLHHNGSSATGWPKINSEVTAGGAHTLYLGIPVVADLDGDNYMEIMVSKIFTQSTLIFNHDASPFTPWMNNEKVQRIPFNEIAVADLDNDGDMEIIGTVHNGVSIVHHNGVPFINKDIQTKGLLSSLMMADMDGDEDFEIIASSEDNRINIWHHNGEWLEGWPIKSESIWDVIPTDINSDGAYEIIVSTYDFVNAYAYNGNLLWSRSLEGIKSKLYSGDINGDGNPEIVFTTEQHENSFNPYSSYGIKLYVNAIEADGTDLDLWPQVIEGSMWEWKNIIIDDFNNNAKSNVLVNALYFSFEEGSISQISCYNSVYDHHPESDFWPTAFYDNGNTKTNPISLDDLKPSLPNGLTTKIKNDNIIINWNKNPEGDIAGYNIYRRTNDNEEKVKLNSSLIIDTLYNDDNADLDTVYHYSIKAVDNNSQESNSTGEVSIAITDPPAPENLTAQPGIQSITLTWDENAELNVEGYNVYRTTKQPLYFDIITPELVTDTVFIDTNVVAGEKYYYYITCVNSLANESWRSNIVNCIPGIFTLKYEFGNSATYNPDFFFADIDNDGDNDLLLESRNSILLYRNTEGELYLSDTIFSRLNTDVLEYNDPIDIELNNFTLGDVNSDGFIDLVIANSLAIEIRLNDGTGKFANIYQFIDHTDYVWYYNLILKDIDNDCDLDLITGSEYPFVLFKNNGNGYFVYDQNIFKSSAEILNHLTSFDVDDDNDNDILFTGISKTRIFTNNDGILSQSSTLDKNPWTEDNAVYADFNYDGKLDIIIGPRLYLNQGAGSFTESNSLFENVDNVNCVSAIGDFQGDGLYDAIYGSDSLFMFSGQNPGFEYYALIGDETDLNFTQYQIKAVDIDNDNDLDIAVSSRKNEFLRIYENNSTCEDIIYSSPGAPATLTSTIDNNIVTLQWTAGTDNETPENGLTYNLRIGSEQGSCDILIPNTIPGFGNVDNKQEVSLRMIKSGTYYWSVQTSDAGYLKSDWAPEQSFTITDDVKPQVCATIPYDGEDWIKTEMEIMVFFEREMDKDYVPSDAFEVTTNHGNATGTVRYIDSIYAFAYKPDERFEPSVWQTEINDINVKVTKLKDTKGNEMIPYTWDFKMDYQDVSIKQVKIISNNGIIRKNSDNEIEVTFLFKSHYPNWLFNEVSSVDEYIMNLDNSRYVIGEFYDGDEWTEIVNFYISNDCPDNHKFSLDFVISGLERRKWNESIKFIVGQPLNNPEIHNSKEFAIYPNPANDFIRIELDENKQVQKIELIDLRGSVILTEIPSNVEGFINIPITEVPEGTYVVRIVTDNKILHKMLVVMR